jgi:hypothetical protein
VACNNFLNLLYSLLCKKPCIPNFQRRKSMRRFLMIIALTSLLSAQGLAGQIPTGGAPVPPAPGGTAPTTDATSPGEIPTGGYAEQISDVALSGLLAVLGLVV